MFRWSNKLSLGNDAQIVHYLCILGNVDRIYHPPLQLFDSLRSDPVIEKRLVVKSKFLLFRALVLSPSKICVAVISVVRGVCDRAITIGEVRTCLS